MRHRKKTVKLGRTAEHRDALLANQTCSLIEHGRIKTTLAKAKAVRPFAEKMITLAKRDTLHARRRALALLHNNSQRIEIAVKKLFSELGPQCAGRQGGYTRIIKLGPRASDSAPMALIEWVDISVLKEDDEPVTDKKSEKKTVVKADKKTDTKADSKAEKKTAAKAEAKPEKKSAKKPDDSKE